MGGPVGGGVTVERVPLARLKPAEWNPRLLKDHRFRQLCASMQADPDFLARRPILALQDGTIYAGNQRWQAARHLGWATVPAIIEDISEKLAKERSVKDNRHQGEDDEQALAEMLVELKLQDSELELLGFDADGLNKLLDSVGALGDTEPPDQQPGESKYKEQYGVIVVCVDEAEQQDVYERLNAEGLNCKVVVT